MERKRKGKEVSMPSPPQSAELLGDEIVRLECEVFLNSRSSDTSCHTFSDDLYNHLIGVRIDTIWDDNKDDGEREEIGDVALTAIWKSKVSIPIFSKNYASSSRCLQELTQMVKCKGSTGQLILPIFYDVQHSDVKHQSGCYEEAFHEHAKCFDDITVEAWKAALREVGQLKGWDLTREPHSHGSEGVKFIKENILPTVLLALKKNCMPVPDNLIGMDHHLNEMMRLLDNVSNEVRIVGIHGMSGIGKTTVAKFIYNKLLECFECCSFLADIRETMQQPKGVSCLQKQILADTLKRCPEIVGVDSGIDSIKNVVVKKKVFIVLDDMDESSHFTRLVGKRDWFHTGSRIIITTKDRHVLDNLKVDATYELPVMDHVQSLQLFSMHAFRKKWPPNDYVNISTDVALTAAGLPLALEVIGSFLSGMEKAVWEDTLKKLEKLSRDEVDKKLRVIYDALDFAQQQIFLDIACLFAGMDKAAGFYMWDDCGYHPERELNVLCLMSLMNVGDANELKMHDQFISLGRKIVYEEKIRGNRSRLWNHEEALNILEGRRGTEKVEALSLHFELGPEKKPRFTSKEFAKLVNLRYLRVDGMDLVGDFEHCLARLRWLNWRSCPSHFKPTNFYLENLVILDLSDSGITEDWGGWNQIKMAKKLKVLQLVNCALRRTPDFTSNAALEILILQQCKSLVEVDRSIGNLKNLKVFDISYTDIRNIPDEIWMLEKLEVIDFTHCSYLKGHIPSNLGSLKSLRFLSFYDTKIQSLPTGISELSGLQTLKLGGCTELQSLPELPSSLRVLYVASLHNLKKLVNLQELHFVGYCVYVEIPRDISLISKLEKLTLDYTNIRTLPKEIDALSQLKVLDVQFCHNLQCILGLPSSLVDLSLAFCASLERLPNLSNLKNLSRLSVRNCIKLTEIQGLGNLESLTRLDIYACDLLANLVLYEQTPCLLSLESMKYMDLSSCNNVSEIDGGEALKSSKVMKPSAHESALLRRDI
ncbi:disease resistance protein L6-like [Cornus florida]|uniref:disease resistance protein L6-like n=1 Tax=Cornus florida TaxID=4283 RepID=UPI00289C949C|nr:disease resistance protein L6-like [Cornus florida]